MSDIEAVAPILTVIEDDGEYIVRASKDAGKRMGQSVLGLLAGARKVTYISDNDVKVFKAKANGSTPKPSPEVPDVQEEFEKTIEESPKPPSKRIMQDSAAPPSPELVGEYEAELKRQQQEAEALRQQEKFNKQDIEVPQPEEVPEPTRKRRERNLAVGGSPCGRCGGSGEIVGDAGFAGSCPVCQGKGEIKAWGRGRKTR